MQALSIPRCRKSGKEGKKLAWLNWELLIKLESKKKRQRQQKQGQLLWMNIRMLLGCGGMGQEDQGPHGTGLGKGCKKEGFYSTLTRKGKSKKLYHSLLHNPGRPITADNEKAEVLNNFLPQSSLSAAFHTLLEWMGQKVGSGLAITLPLKLNIRFVTT